MLDIESNISYRIHTFPNMKIEILQTSQHTLLSRGQYYWHVKNDKGQIVSDSGKPYRTKDICMAMASKIKESLPNASIVDLTRG